MKFTLSLRTWMVLAFVGIIVSLLSARLSTKLLPVSDTSPVVVIDPGHGGQDPGAVGANGVYEKNINLSVSLILATLLPQKQLTVYLTRSNDQLPSSPPFTTLRDLQQRVLLSRRWHATIFVSIHTNSEPTGTVQGPIVYYRSGSPLSLALATNVSQALSTLNGRVIPPRPIHQLVLEQAGVPAINVEVGFLTHPLDQSRLVNSSYQTQIAQAVSLGILHYLRRGQ
ncbi:MAG: N-acetylmuramoyl-L-alanine amidase [Firmicutes bacterium]|jgi:N-acetylmuramoyl-L-alanine amidase|nr:N-acetylmuramoyl-L-alanine amidase [Bacillota bacterium]MCL5014624.1 N-acetylmuramoyl-L-alanine amidase [Bacillota bacterium]